MSEIPDAVLELVRAYPGYTFILLAIVGMCETFLANDFNEIYYRTGFPVFKVEAPLPAVRPLDRSCLDAITPLPNWSLRLAYGKIGPEEFAVREPGFRSGSEGQTGYTGVMHAILSVDPATRNVRLVGRNSWTLLGILAFFFVFLGWTSPGSAAWWLFHTVPFAVVLAIYILQAKIYKSLVNQVAAALAQASG